MQKVKSSGGGREGSNARSESSLVRPGVVLARCGDLSTILARLMLLVPVKHKSKEDSEEEVDEAEPASNIESSGSGR